MNDKSITPEACACEALGAEVAALRAKVAALEARVDALEAEKLKLISAAVKAMEAVALVAQKTDAVSRIRLEEVNWSASSTRYGRDV